MSSSEAEADGGRPLYVSIEMVANLIYLAQHSEGKPEDRRQYLDRASEILLELRRFPELLR